ncbi:ATP phosphoribosyltransferase [Candidatus Peregrinibacteria bacterium]|jgi:ATP phosphoribosyltransferase|nr:ATP phosphoribosyltransferase [Candidatus Peregrinibacteria bacterium]MBT4056036.1 ATP phosphoribosyltransferase [Candidatus Peregrinibacteria bacterium]
MNQKNKKIRIAIQKRGRLQEPSLNFLKNLGLKFKPNGSKLITLCTNANVEILYVRNSDIPQYVKYGVADYGIVGENVLIEKKAKLKIIRRLGFGKCKLIIAVPKKSNIKTINDLSEERIATSYLNTLKQYLKNKKINASTIEINGSVEICPTLNMADAICDITQTGTTLKENNLEIIEKILDSEAVLIESPFTNQNLTPEQWKNIT